MLSCTYEVVAIDGDYAHLRRNDIEPEDNETKLVARALLPPEIMGYCFALMVQKLVIIRL